jgi:oligopeptide transport system substrate-binding protein
MFRFCRFAAPALAAMLLACSPSSGEHRVSGPDVLNRGNSAEIKSLDPHYIDGTWEANVVGDMLIGLMTDGANGKPIPGAATSWETSADGKTWTFHMRDHLWSDGQPVTAQDFVFAWRRILEPARGAPYAYYLWLIKNAHDVNTGKLPGAALGVSAPDDKTFVVQLEHPAPYLLEYLLHQTTFPVPRHVVMAKGDAWARPENYVANGAYVPKEWVVNDHLTLVKNPKFYDAAHVRLQTVNYYPTQDTEAALKRVRAGELDTQTILPSSEVDWMRAHMADALQLNLYLGVEYLVPNVSRAPFNDKRLREALSLAYDRETIVTKIVRMGDPVAYSFVPPGVANYPGGAVIGFRSMPFAQRLAKARELMAELGYGPAHRLHTTLDTTPTPDNRRVAAATQEMWRQIYVDIDIVQTDTQLFYRKIQQHDFNIATAAWIGDFNDASGFLDLLRTGSGNNYGQYNSTAFTALFNEAQQQVDTTKRGLLMKQAEQIALDDVAVIPTRFRVTQDLVQPYVKGWIPNLRDFNRSRWLWIDEKEASQ